MDAADMVAVADTVAAAMRDAAATAAVAAAMRDAAATAA
jgi:hypothetical protein